MNSVHDMGGMHGMGPLGYAASEPVFHAHWEARIYAASSAVGAWRRWNIDASRHQREQIPAPDYLRMSYYQHWYFNLTTLAVQHVLITAAELASGKPDPGSAKLVPPLTADNVAEMRAEGSPKLRPVAAQPRFQPGAAVRARNMHPTGHTRLPRYVRGRTGVIERHHGAHVFPDSNAQFLGEAPQHLYTVRFAAREVWGEAAHTRDAVYLDLWESYLEPT
jgi:nitrile hydratase beta subunit